MLLSGPRFTPPRICTIFYRETWISSSVFRRLEALLDLVAKAITTQVGYRAVPSVILNPDFENDMC